MRYVFPLDYATAPCFLSSINRSMVPIIAGQVAIMEQPGSWANDEDYHAGYNAILAFERCLMALCMDDLMASNDRLYRLLDTALLGTAYTVESEEPLVISPAIPLAPSVAIVNQDALIGRIDRLTQLLDNAINGTETPLYDSAPSVKALLQGIIDALSADNTDLDDILAQLEAIALLVA